MKNKKGVSKGKVVAVGAGLAALGAGAYYFLGPNGKKNRAKTSLLLKKVEKEVKAKVGKIKSKAEPIYHKAVDTMAATYAKQYKAHEPEIKMLAKKLKQEWKSVKTMAKNAKAPAKTAKPKSKKTAKKRA